MGIKATGILRHIFHGSEESARIGLQFASREEAEQAIETLWENSIGEFQLGGNGYRNAASSFTSEKLEKAKIFFNEKCNITIVPCGFPNCKNQCKDAPIDNLKHSVDYGATFTLEIPFPLVPNEQAKLFS